MNKNKRLDVDDRNDVIIKVSTFIISPFLSFLYSLRTMNTRSSYIVFFLFSVLFGLAFSVSGDYFGMAYYIDGMFYRIEFNEYCRSSYADFLLEWKEYISFSGKIKDFYFNSVAFFISRITYNYHVMFAVFAAVFAYFQLKCLAFFTKDKNYTNSIFTLILAFIFTWNQIFNINGVRFNTAAWIYVYCVFQIFLNGNKKYFLLLAFTPFFHAAFYAYAIVLVIAYFTKESRNFWKVAYIISFFVSGLSTILLRTIGAFLPDVLANFTNEYSTDAGALTPELLNTSSISGFLLSISSLYFGFLILWLVLKYKDGNDKSSNNIYSAFVILATMMNFFSSISSLGSRMSLMIYPLLACVWLMCFGTKKYSWMIFLFPLLMIISIRTRYEQYRMVTDTSFWFSNPISIMIKYLQ